MIKILKELEEKLAKCALDQWSEWSSQEAKAFETALYACKNAIAVFTKKTKEQKKGMT